MHAAQKLNARRTEIKVARALRAKPRRKVVLTKLDRLILKYQQLKKC